MMSFFAGSWLGAFCVVVAMTASVIISRTAYSQTADCQAEATSVAGLRTSSTAPGVYAGSTSGTGEPGIANAGSDENARLWADVYAACVRRHAASLPQPRKRASEPMLLAPEEVKQKKR
jgi:hypothetical protein